jgi:hypothetical protein
MRSLLLLPILLLLAGCQPDGYAELGLVAVAGKVTLDGQPLANANVIFESADKRTSSGVTDSAGSYSLKYDSETPGVTPGPKTVRITTANVGAEGGGAAEGAAPTGQERIPAKYNRQSELKADVSASNKTFNFDLKSIP